MPIYDHELARLKKKKKTTKLWLRQLPAKKKKVGKTFDVLAKTEKQVPT